MFTTTRSFYKPKEQQQTDEIMFLILSSTFKPIHSANSFRDTNLDILSFISIRLECYRYFSVTITISWQLDINSINDQMFKLQIYISVEYFYQIFWKLYFRITFASLDRIYVIRNKIYVLYYTINYFIN